MLDAGKLKACSRFSLLCLSATAALFVTAFLQLLLLLLPLLLLLLPLLLSPSPLLHLDTLAIDRDRDMDLKIDRA
jgi:hypothetical protein